MKLIPVIIGTSLALWAAAAQAEVKLFEWALNRDGILTGTGDPAPPGFDVATGLGTVVLTFSNPGTHGAFMFVDHELSEDINTFFNEVGSASGTPGTGQSWEIDEPGFAFGDIYENFLAGTPDNSVGTTDPEDVSMLMGWDFSLLSGQTGIVRFRLSESQPSEGFYLTQWDPDSDEAVYFSSSLTIRTDGVVPETASTLMLLLLGLGGLAGFVRRGDTHRLPIG